MTRSIKLKGRLKGYMQLPLFLTILLIVLNVPMYFWDVRAGVAVSVFLVIYIIVVAITYNSYKPMLVNELINFATQYGTVQKKLINEFEIPYALLDYNGRVLWVNEKFTELTGKDKRFHKSISTIFPGITKELIRQEEKIESLDVVWEDHYFRVKMNKIYFEEMMESSPMVELHQAEEYLTAVYLFDETQLNQCRQENEDQKLVASLVYIDNYEEALNSIEDVKRSLLIALIERKINKYFSQMDGLVRKIEKDKFFVVFQHKYLAQMEENKFSLLEDVKTVKVGNEMAVTLSIGIGVMGATYTQNYEYARMAIDLALGRGGDQVVLKKGGEIFYYGGNTKQVDKNTRVKARVKAHALREILESKEHVMIMGHSIPDVDAFGAAVGIYCAAKVLGKHAQIVINEVTSSLRPIKDCFTVDRGYPEDLFLTSERALDAIDSNTLVVVVDTNRPSYTECPDLLKRAKSVVVFDHHRQGSEVIKNPLLSYIEPYASSTCEMIAEVLQYFSENIKLTPEEADCIYAGILIDTSNFMTKTGVRTFEAAAYLRRCGAEVTRVRKMLQNNMSDYKARAEVIRHAQVYRGSFAISICPAGEIESPTVVGAQAANELLNIIGIRASFVLTEYQGKIYVSSRSIDEINVQRIMERLGGGGHMNTAGCQIQGCSLKQAEKLIEVTIDEMIEEGEIKE